MNEKELTRSEITSYLNSYFSIIENSWKMVASKRIPFDELFEMVKEIHSLITKLNEISFESAGNYCRKHYIPLLELLLTIDFNNEHKIKYSQLIYKAYRISARTSLESYMIYREWNEKDKFYEPRYEALNGYIHFLQEIALNPDFELLIFNGPSGIGKTFPEKISEAWNFGVDPTGTTLSLCSNDSVVKGGSQLVIDEIKSQAFGEVFPNMQYTKEDRNFFLKETAGEWKLRDCKLLASYYASTVNSNVVGSRASQRIHIDDLYADYLEAMNQNLNEYFFNKYLTVWTKRFVQNKKPKIVVTGTLWASNDFIAQLIADVEKKNVMKPHKKYKYVRTNEDETIAIIQVPALDYITGESTVPDVKSTEEILKDKESMDEYLFQTNFQQLPTDPDDLAFSYNNLRTYKRIPPTDYYGTYSVIDATRKSGKDFFAMPIFTKVINEDIDDYYLKDALFTKTATKDMYDDVVNKIIEHHIILLIIESNVTSELKQNVEAILKSKGATFCEIREKYNTENKLVRITAEKGNIRRRMVFPEKGSYGKSTDMGRAMNNLTSYNENGRNAHEDFPDALALMSHEIIDGGSKPKKAKAIQRPF